VFLTIAAAADSSSPSRFPSQPLRERASRLSTIADSFPSIVSARKKRERERERAKDREKRERARVPRRSLYRYFKEKCELPARNLARDRRRTNQCHRPPFYVHRRSLYRETEEGAKRPGSRIYDNRDGSATRGRLRCIPAFAGRDVTGVAPDSGFCRWLGPRFHDEVDCLFARRAKIVQAVLWKISLSLTII